VSVGECIQSCKDHQNLDRKQVCCPESLLLPLPDSSALYSQHLQLLAITTLSSALSLPFLECRINRIRSHATFGVWLLSLCRMHLQFSLTVAHIGYSVPFYCLSGTPLDRHSMSCLCIHQLMAFRCVWLLAKFYQPLGTLSCKPFCRYRLSFLLGIA
jgi:hypothetical protein